ncbi:MAG: hypothetical protein KGJ60_06110 [Verrucomicrobiota bacterium]|nr:hypothetical protein [Verrucomicrobiota bacterium]
MTLQEQYDEAMFDFSRGDFDRAIARLKGVLIQDAAHFDAQLAMGMAFYRKGDFASAIAEGHKAEALRPAEQLVHTNLSLFYQRAGDKQKAEQHGLQARIASWRAEAAKPNSSGAGSSGDPGLPLARPKAPHIQFPSQPWKKKTKAE